MHDAETGQVLADIRDIAKAQDELSEEAGTYWGPLGESHRALIEQHGFGNFKRTINFQYGQWGIATFGAAFTRQLFKNLIKRGRLPWGALARADVTDADHIAWPGNGIVEETANRKKLRAYAMYCGLLWQYAQQNDALKCLRIAEPSFGRPVPIRLGGRLISQDLAMASLSLNRMAEHIPLSSTKSVLEIGAGYGRLAYLFRSLFPQASYTIVDISPALAVSQNYIAKIFGEEFVQRFSGNPKMSARFNFLVPRQLERTSQTFDLVINISSFDEMPADVSTRYIKTIERVCRGHLYLNGYARTSNWGNNRLGLDELPYPAKWKRIFSGTDAVFFGRHDGVVDWVEKIFAV